MAKLLLFGILLFLGCTFTPYSHAQTTDPTAVSAPGNYRYLLLAKAGSLARYRIHIGESVTFKRFQDKHLRTEQILDIRGNSFYVANQEIPLKDVEKIRLRNHTGGRKVAGFMGSLFKGAGVVFTLVGAINFLTQSDDREDGLHTMGAALGMYGIGAGLHGFRKGTYKLNEKWTLKVIEMY